MIEGRPFLYQAKNRTVYHVSENGVQAIRSWSSTEEIVAFVDGDKDDSRPGYMMLFNESVQIVLTTSPRGASKKWINQIGHINILATKLWSPRELFLAGFVLGLLLSMLNSYISLGHSFIPLISLSSYSGSRPCISATIPVYASMLPAP